ncbi:ArpU family phage packaging/lysis transcriptional regulator [Paenibacillus sp. SAF-054]|uniref:ArpU family phage packaging/lysis transcriptional regulator n=1 Tax=unclassified Paenibacillus TaxID=185978 RepID=UPI003F7D8348
MSFLPEIDRKRTQEAVEAILERYRMYKFLTFEEREANTTSSISDIPRSFTGTTSDQTANIAIYNVDTQAKQKSFCERVERVVKRMPRMEGFLIQERYMTIEHDYITDQHVYNHVFQPPISEGKYSKVRWKAFYKLASNFDVLVEKEKEVNFGEGAS